MRKYIASVFLFFSIYSYSNQLPVLDTISYWKVYNGGRLIQEGNALNKDIRIVLDKGKITRTDILNVRYFDDTPCSKCPSLLIVKTISGVEIKKIKRIGADYSFNIKTSDLQLIAINNKSPVLRFYFNEDESYTDVFLFEIEIK